MTKDAFYDSIKCELENQEQLLKASKENVAKSIKGRIYIRENKNSRTFYQVISNDCERERINISDQPEIIIELLLKAQQQETLRICRGNIRVLKQFLKKYQPLQPLAALKQNERDAFLELYTANLPVSYYKAPFDPERHVHETVRGDMVSSKGEVIIVNALWHYEIPFNYEEMFPYPDEDGNWFYPDFTIHCPDGTVIIWEHLGMLDKLSYCVRNGNKLHTYHENNYVIGKSLILTQDDKNGNCSTALAYHIIENYILPHFK